VRTWDFPRVHIAAGFVLLLPLAMLLSGAGALVIVGVGLARGAYQIARIRPHTLLA
jgi:hypothetical protein